MRALVRKILAVAVGLYILAAMVAVPYFNWQYAQAQGFVRWLFLGELVATAKGLAWPYFVAKRFSAVEWKAGKGNNVRLVAEAPPREYVDHQYQFAFQFPADWKFEKNPPPGEAGEVRVIIRHPTKPMWVQALVGHLDKAVTKHQFESSPNRDAAVEGIMELSLEAYKKISRDVGAERMIVSEKKILPSDAGIQFYISTAHRKGNMTLLVAGIHIVPFEKPHILTFMMVAPVDPTATKDNETIDRVFNSFHILGERPIKPSDPSQVSAQDLTCNNYGGLAESQKISLTYGYLEGLQASLDKDAADILVPPSDPEHPMWWVLPMELGKNPAVGLAHKLEQHCQSGKNQQKRLLDAFLSVAYQKSGQPAFGISIDKKKTDPWKSFLGGKESSVSCSAYNASPVETRQAIIYGYYLGTQALKVALKESADIGIAWPSKLSPQAVRIEVDKHCQKPKPASLRDVLWPTTVELAVKRP